MGSVTSDENIVVERDYTDIYSIKETAINKLGPKYFEGIDISGLNVGELGFVLEQIGNITEDSFNTASILIKESFPNKAVIPESIYSHAAIFQIDNTFANCAKCVFVMLLKQDEILSHGTKNGSKTIYCIDKNTVFTVEDIPFTLDYDIKIEAVKHQIAGDEYDYNFSAKYIFDMDNSISELNDPYLKIRKIPNGFLLVQLTAHQVERVELTDTIISNTKINYPLLEFEFDGNLAGFDVFYKSPTDSDYTQLEKRIKFSLPIKRKFCYYKLKNESTLQITFSTRDGYFQPEFNSEIKIVMYLTLGTKGNFESYSGSNIEIRLSSDRYEYNTKTTFAFKPVSDSAGGSEKMSDEALQALTVESYSNATELSNENDIMKYFYDYKYRYGNEMLVIKRRDDITERLFSSFLLMKNEDYIYPTNTLHLDITESEFDMKQDGYRFTLKPGHTFVYKEGSMDTMKLVPGVMSYHTDEVNKLLEENQFVYTNPFLISMSKNPSSIGLYQNIVNQTSILDYISSNDDSFVQFITSKITLTRGLSDESSYNLSLSIIPSSSMDEYITKLNTYEGNDVRVIAGFTDTNLSEVGYIELLPTAIDENDKTSVTFSATLETNDYITSNAKFPITNAVKIDIKSDYMYIPISDVLVNIYILYNDALTETNIFSRYFDGMEYFTVTNKYSTRGDLLTFISPLNMMRSKVIFSNIGTANEPTVNANISLLPVVKADIINNTESFNIFINRFTSNYRYMEKCLPILRNNTNLDIKFYNSYGKSKNYYIGDENELIDRVNISIKLKVTIVDGSDDVDLKKGLQVFIKEFIEKLNSDGSNDLYISNLIREIETRYSSVHHLKFLGINEYNTDYQTISVKATDLNNLTKEERRNYVPEILVVDKNSIFLSIVTN